MSREQRNLTATSVLKNPKANRETETFETAKPKNFNLEGERLERDSPGKKIYTDRDTFARTDWLIIPHEEQLVNFPIDREKRRRRRDPEEHEASDVRER